MTDPEPRRPNPWELSPTHYETELSPRQPGPWKLSDRDIFVHKALTERLFTQIPNFIVRNAAKHGLTTEHYGGRQAWTVLYTLATVTTSKGHLLGERDVLVALAVGHAAEGGSRRPPWDPMLPMAAVPRVSVTELTTTLRAWCITAYNEWWDTEIIGPEVEGCTTNDREVTPDA